MLLHDKPAPVADVWEPCHAAQGESHVPGCVAPVAMAQQGSRPTALHQHNPAPCYCSAAGPSLQLHSQRRKNQHRHTCDKCLKLHNEIRF